MLLTSSLSPTTKASWREGCGQGFAQVRVREALVSRSEQTVQGAKQTGVKWLSQTREAGRRSSREREIRRNVDSG